MITTKSGQFRIFSVKDEPRDRHRGPAADLSDAEVGSGDWTFEPTDRPEDAVARIRRIQGKSILPWLYARLYEDADEALAQAEICDREDDAIGRRIEVLL